MPASFSTYFFPPSNIRGEQFSDNPRRSYYLSSYTMCRLQLTIFGGEMWLKTAFRVDSVMYLWLGDLFASNASKLKRVLLMPENMIILSCAHLIIHKKHHPLTCFYHVPALIQIIVDTYPKVVCLQKMLPWLSLSDTHGPVLNFITEFQTTHFQFLFCICVS